MHRVDQPQGAVRETPGDATANRCTRMAELAANTDTTN